MSRAAVARPDHKALAKESIKRGAIQKPGELMPLLRLVGKLRLRAVLEIGTFAGGTLYAWCKLVKPDGLIVSIDLPAEAGGQGPNDLEHLHSYALPGQELHLLRTDSHKAATLSSLE